MKKTVLLVIGIAFSGLVFAQDNSALWKGTAIKSDIVRLDSRMNLPEKRLFTLNLTAARNTLGNSPQRGAAARASQTVIAIPNAEGVLENFRIYESSNMEPSLAARYPEIKSYVGIGIENPTATAYFSVSPLGFKSMVIYADRSATFIEPLSKDLTTYTVYKKSDKAASLSKFECKVVDVAKVQLNTKSQSARPNADDGMLRTFRLAMSCTGEYTAYFGGTKALALAAINNSLTRVNGVFEKDFGVHMNLIGNTDAVIYTNATTDPYSPASGMSKWNSQLQSTLTSVIGEANYDIGHLFGASGGGGNAGCIACVCVNGKKGSGITSPADGIPQGDNFDIDYVAHEMGHQFGGNHTFTFSNEGTIAQVEPGSGTTIMGYAGITGATDVQAHSDPFFHAVSIQQVTNYIKSTSCQTNTATGNAIPTVNAGQDYTIPKGTPFMLTASAADANADALTYDWEQMDKGTSTTTYPKVTATSGPAFKSFVTSTSPVRYFPQMATVLTGATSWKWEAVPNVARTMNFRVTVRDNHAGGPANNSDDMIVTVNGNAGPFTVSSPNTAVSYIGGTSQTVTWNVAGTTGNGVNCAKVDILLSTDGGSTWTGLLAATPNDGTQAVTIPNTPGTTNRIMVKGSNHIFFDVSNTNFTITPTVTDTQAPTAPTLSASGTTQTGTDLSWSGATDNVAVTGYDIYQNGTFIATTAASAYTVGGLNASTDYIFTVKAKDAAGLSSEDSNAVTVTTLAPVPDTQAPTAPTLSASGTTQTSTDLSWSGATDNVAVTGYDIYQNGVFKASTAATGYTVSGLSQSTAYSFTVRAKDAAGNASADSNTVSVTTLATGGASILFSEYLEGTGNNKALEIANNTGSAVSLAGYSIRVQTDGAGAWSNGLALSGTLNNGAKYVIVNTAIKSNCYSKSTANIATSATEMTFTGNDPVGLFKNGVLIDIIGTFNGGSANFAIDVTLRRKATVTAPNTTFNLGAEWNSFGTNTCGGLGNKGDISDTQAADLSAMVLYPNPVSGSELTIANATNANYRIINTIGMEIANGTIENDRIQVGELAAGVYFLEVALQEQTAVKRFIKR